jgi:hypothetical protein
MFSNTKSIDGNKAEKKCCTADGLTRAFSEKLESEAHERDGVPDVMVVDRANARDEGDFRRILHGAGC